MAAIHIVEQRPNVKFVGTPWPKLPKPGSGSYTDVQSSFTWLRMQPEHEFWASYLGTFNRHITRDVPTAAVTLEGGDLMMLINPDYVAWDLNKSMAMMAGPTVHEMHHPLMGHLGDAGPPAGDFGNICADLSVNSVMPNGMRHPFHLHPSQFEVNGIPLPAGRGWKFYWDELFEVFSLGEIEGLLPGDIDDRLDLATFGYKGEPGSEAGSLIYSLTRQKLERAASSMGKSRIPEIVNFMMKTKFAPVEVIWHVALKSTCRGYTRKKKLRTMGKRGRRTQMPPGPQKAGESTILWGIDTSGSMADREIDKGYAVLDEVRQRDGVKVLVQQFDSILQGPLVELDRFRKIPTDVIGRGGTNFGPLFELARKIKPSILCVFTDGHATPVKPPPFPTCWVYPPEHKKQGFGKHIVVNDRPASDDKEW